MGGDTVVNYVVPDEDTLAALKVTSVSEYILDDLVGFPNFGVQG